MILYVCISRHQSSRSRSQSLCLLLLLLLLLPLLLLLLLLLLALLLLAAEVGPVAAAGHLEEEVPAEVRAVENGTVQLLTVVVEHQLARRMMVTLHLREVGHPSQGQVRVQGRKNLCPPPAVPSLYLTTLGPVYLPLLRAGVHLSWMNLQPI